MRSEEPIKNFKVAESAGEATYVQEYVNQSVFELFAPPESDSHLTLVMDGAKDLVVDDPEWVVALNKPRLEEADIELPMCVVKVTREIWRKAE